MGIYVQPKDREAGIRLDGKRGAFVRNPKNGSWSWKRLKGWKRKVRKPLPRPDAWNDPERGLWWEALYLVVQEAEDDWDFDFLSEWMDQLHET